ncbi:hypothetical protein I4F81_010059 [Pyropia yezoensis]|uniref:Uncharacterized protein n=1 Tax=Pyropia yezoensis TaxID=2788 RepID=A0ACC3CCK5_PYRYE|nr:hypothetical protein I4F81_010059 [Neopyropia yezoensis]
MASHESRPHNGDPPAANQLWSVQVVPASPRQGAAPVERRLSLAALRSSTAAASKAGYGVGVGGGWAVTYARRAAGPPARPPPGAVEVLDFVTQRAVQTYLFYRRSFRDSVTADWVEAATGLGPLGEVHDFVFRGTDRYLRALGALPPRTVHVQTRVACQGGSADNPYRPVRYVGYDVDISPPAVVAALCGVREGVAVEVTADLGRVGAENERLWGAYLVGVEDPPVNGGVERDVEDAAEAAAAGAATRGGFHMVDTRRLAQAVLTERLAVAAEWKAALARVPAAHAALRRELLQKSLDASA